MPARAMVEVEIPDGWELACERMRPPEDGEYWWREPFENVYMQWRADELPPNAPPICNTSDPKVIVRPAWQWPAWLKAPWIAKGPGGNWLGYETEPTLFGAPDDQYWYTEDDSICLDQQLVDFTPPPITDWRQSKRKNPRE